MKKTFAEEIAELTMPARKGETLEIGIDAGHNAHFGNIL